MAELLQLEPEAKVVVASGYSEDAQVRDCLDAGAAAFLAKPFRIPKLGALVRQLSDG